MHIGYSDVPPDESSACGENDLSCAQLCAQHPDLGIPSTPSIVFVHGIKVGPNNVPWKGSDAGWDCIGDYWGDAMNFLRRYEIGDFRTIKYYNGDTNCDNGAETAYSSDLHDPLYSQPCANYHADAGSDGTNDESIYHLSCLFAQYLYQNFGQYNKDVVLVGHSMGGIIIRETMYQMQEHAGQSPFPDTIGHVTWAVTFNTPHGGVNAAAAPLSCAGCTQVADMSGISDLMLELRSSGENPQTSEGFTDWTVIGSECDNIAGGPLNPNGYANAIDMHASHAVVYASGSDTCYDHSQALHDTNANIDAHQYYCDTSDPNNSPCGTDYKKRSNWQKEKNRLRGLSELFYSATGFAVSGAERAGRSPRLWLLSAAVTAWALLRRKP